MYDSFLPDFNAGPAFYANNKDTDLTELIVNNAKSYFTNAGIEFTSEISDSDIRFSTSAGLFVVNFRDGAPSSISVYSVGGSKVKEFRDSLWTVRKAFGFPVMAVMDQANDGYFETHPSQFMVILFPKSFGF